MVLTFASLRGIISHQAAKPQKKIRTMDENELAKAIVNTCYNIHAVKHFNTKLKCYKILKNGNRGF